jgi:hypothetical protein
MRFIWVESFSTNPIFNRLINNAQQKFIIPKEIKRISFHHQPEAMKRTPVLKPIQINQRI